MDVRNSRPTSNEKMFNAPPSLWKRYCYRGPVRTENKPVDAKSRESLHSMLTACDLGSQNASQTSRDRIPADKTDTAPDTTGIETFCHHDTDARQWTVDPNGLVCNACTGRGVRSRVRWMIHWACWRSASRTPPDTPMRKRWHKTGLWIAALH